jgi:hypothetical protein
MRRSAPPLSFPSLFFAAAAVTSLLLTACSSGGGGTVVADPPGTFCSTDEVIQRVELAETGAVAVFKTGSPPPGNAAAVALSVSGSSTAVAGSTGIVNIQSTVLLDTLFVRVGEADGFWELPVTIDQFDYTLLITVVDDPCGADVGFDCIYGGAAGGQVSEEEVVDPVTLVEPGTGQVRVTLQWSATNDLDLHVIDPFGEEIFFANPTSDSGGTLDFDSNISCIPDGGVENIFWPENGAPSGNYQVIVDNFTACESAAPYTVTVSVNGSESLFFGTLFSNEAEDFVTEFVVP